MTRPTECPRCQQHFTPIMEVQARHILVTEGASAARAFVDEKLETFHEEHEKGDR